MRIKFKQFYDYNDRFFVQVHKDNYIAVLSCGLKNSTTKVQNNVQNNEHQDVLTSGPTATTLSLVTSLRHFVAITTSRLSRLLGHIKLFLSSLSSFSRVGKLNLDPAQTHTHFSSLYRFATEGESSTFMYLNVL